MERQKVVIEITQRPNNKLIIEEQKFVVSLVFRLKGSNPFSKSGFNRGVFICCFCLQEMFCSLERGL